MTEPKSVVLPLHHGSILAFGDPQFFNWECKNRGNRLFSQRFFQECCGPEFVSELIEESRCVRREIVVSAVTIFGLQHSWIYKAVDGHGGHGDFTADTAISLCRPKISLHMVSYGFYLTHGGHGDFMADTETFTIHDSRLLTKFDISHEFSPGNRIRKVKTGQMGCKKYNHSIAAIP